MEEREGAGGRQERGREGPGKEGKEEEEEEGMGWRNEGEGGREKPISYWEGSFCPQKPENLNRIIIIILFESIM